MKSITDTEHCSIIDSACPYDYGCSMCRLHNDYEAALEKSRELAEIAGAEGADSCRVD